MNIDCSYLLPVIVLVVRLFLVVPIKLSCTSYSQLLKPNSKETIKAGKQKNPKLEPCGNKPKLTNNQLHRTRWMPKCAKVSETRKETTIELTITTTLAKMRVCPKKYEAQEARTVKATPKRRCKRIGIDSRKITLQTVRGNAK